LLKDKGCNHIPNALIIYSILNPFEDSINAQAFQQESAMVGVYTKMKPDSFKSQLQAVLTVTAFYEDIKGVQGASCCPKTKMVKRQFKDQEDAGTTPQDETGIDDAGGAASAPAAGAASGCSPRRRGGACSCTCIC
jgi:hypothetical protein